MRPLSLLNFILILLLPAITAQAYEGEEYPGMYQDAPADYSQDIPQDIPQENYPDQGYPDEQYPEQTPDQNMPMEEPMMEEPAYSPEQAPEYQHHLLEIHQSCDEAANNAELQAEERDQFILDCLQSQGIR